MTSSVPTPRRPRPRSAGTTLSVILYVALLLAALLLAAGQPPSEPSATPLPPLQDRTPDIRPSRSGYRLLVTY
jgi:hypothetical protein